ncbi:MAG: STAS domain-containing protein [Thermoleophilia bacterium]|nr:STAS domain-containing protein [Thermoleophilia bacterium]
MQGVEVIRPADNTAVLALHGEHDMATKEELARLLSDEISANDLVVVDVSDAAFVDSSFLHNLVKADRLASDRGSRFVLQMGTARIVRAAIEVSGLLAVLDCAHSRDEALSKAPTADPPIGSAT